GAAGLGNKNNRRAGALFIPNIGGPRAGGTPQAVFGPPGGAGFCVGGGGGRSPLASPAHRRGVAARAQRVTVHGGQREVPTADIHNDDARDLLYLIAKSLAYPLANMFLGNVENGEVVVAFNPMWAERFGAVFPDIAGLTGYLQENAWQPIDLWPEANARLLHD